MTPNAFDVMTSFGFTVNCCALEVPPPGAGFVTVMLNVPAVARSVTGIAAVSCVALMKVVVRAEPLKFTAELETKLPFTVSVKAASVTDLLVGEMLVVVGVTLFTVNVCALDVPPPGTGFVTVMLDVPAVVRSLAGMEAVSCVELIEVVVRAEPPKFTTEFVTKLVPLTVSVKTPSPTFLLVGEMLVVVGAGLLTVNVCALEVPPPGVGFVTVMLNVPAVVRSLAGIDAVNGVAVTYVVLRAEPGKLTTEVEPKFVPFTVRVK